MQRKKGLEFTFKRHGLACHMLLIFMLRNIKIQFEERYFIMSNRYLFLWFALTLIGTSLCQNYKNIPMIFIVVTIVTSSILLFFFKRVKTYHINDVSHYKLMLFYEILAVIMVSVSLMFLGVFYFDKSAGVNYLLYSLHVLPLIPIIINTAIIKKNNKHKE